MRRNNPGPQESRSLNTVAIIGAGPLGRWLALAAARAGYRVFLEDVMPANLHHAEEYLRRQLGPGTLGQPTLGGQNPPSQDLPDGTAVQFVSSIEDAVRDADLVIDCVPDELESKLEILWLLDRMAPPKTVLATPTTNLSIADLASCTYRAEKCIAIVAEARALSRMDQAENATEITLRRIVRTLPEALELVVNFWENVGFTTRVEIANV